MKVLHILFLFAALAFLFPANAQNIIIKGTIQDAHSFDFIPFANVGLYRPSDTIYVRGATTNLEGQFVISDVPAGAYLMRISVVGYEPYTQTLGVSSATDLGIISLHAGIALQEVQIVSERPIFTMDGEKNIYNTGDDPSIQTGTASDALQNAPGIEIDADGNITLRGTQSVDVWINDRPSHMDGEALKQYVKMLPANSIQRIEVISNPSARYGGGTPVVNIITTQKIQRNEFVSVGFNGSSRPDQRIWLSEVKPWLSYVFANEKFTFNIYANGGYSKRESEYHGSSVMLDNNRDTARISDYYSTENNKGIESYIGGHLSYNIDSHNTMGAWYGVYPHWHESSEWGRSERYDYLNGLAVNNTYEGTESTPMNSTPNGGGYFGTWYEHRFDDSTGHKINMNINGNGYFNHGFTHHERHYEVLAANDIVRDVDSYDRYLNGGFGIDYTLPFGRMDTNTHSLVNELDAGMEFNRENSRKWNFSDWSSMGFLAGKADSIDRDFNYCINDLSSYVTYQRRFGHLTAKLGLRGELSNQSMDFFNVDGYDSDTVFFNLTPSLHLSYSTKSMHNFSFSFTRRINQPNVSSLTYYKKYELDNYGDWGNPDLRPSYNQRVELQWDKYFMKLGSIGAQLYYSANTDEESTLANVCYSDYYGTIVSYTQPMNIGNSYTAGLDINATFRPSSFINIRFMGSLVYDNEDFTFRGESYQNSVWSYRLRLNAWAKLWKNYQFFINARYGSPTKSIFTSTNAHKGIDVGVNADFFDRKFAVNLNIHDIFNMNAWSSSNDNPYLTTTSNWKPMSRFITLGLTLRFGKMELQNMAREGAESTESAPSH